jgi:Fe-S cluster biogenesis protein NfuA
MGIDKKRKKAATKTQCCRVDSVNAATGDVFVEMQGACGSCPSSVVTLKNGLERWVEVM